MATKTSVRLPKRKKDKFSVKPREMEKGRVVQGPRQSIAELSIGGVRNTSSNVYRG